MNDRLHPNSWPQVPLGQLGKWGSGGTPKRGVDGFYHGSIPWLKIGDLTDGIVTTAEESITEAGLRSSAAKLVEPGTLLVAMYGSIGKLGIPTMRCATNQAIAHCIPDSRRVLTEYLFHALLAQRNELIAQGKGGTQANISQTVLKAFRVPVPPLPVQSNIVQFARRVSEIQARAEMRLAGGSRLVKRFRYSLLAAAYSGRLTQGWRDAHSEATVELGQLELRRRMAFDRRESSKQYSIPVPNDTQNLPDIPKSWNWVSADAVSSQITDGEHIQPPYQATGFPMLSAKHVRDGFVDATGAGVIAADAFQNARRRCAPAYGDLLVVSVGATTGRTAIVQIEEPFAIVRSVLLLKSLLQPRFLLNWLQSQWAFDWMRQASGASAQPHLYIRDFRRLPVPVPPLAEQEEIVRLVGALLAQADSIEQRLSGIATRVGKASRVALDATPGNGLNEAAVTTSA